MLTNLFWVFTLIYLFAIQPRLQLPLLLPPPLPQAKYAGKCESRGKQGRLKVFARVPRLRLRTRVVKVKLDVSRLQTRQPLLDKSDAAGHSDTAVLFFILLIPKRRPCHSYEGDISLSLPRVEDCDWLLITTRERRRSAASTSTVETCSRRLADVQRPMRFQPVATFHGPSASGKQARQDAFKKPQKGKRK